VDITLNGGGNTPIRSKNTKKENVQLDV